MSAGRQYRTRAIVTIGALSLAIVHVLWPSIQIDAITLVLLAFAALPWLAPLFSSVEFPGGLKIELRELREAEREAEGAGLLGSDEAANTSADEQRYSYQLVADEDPNLALAGLRIEIERRLVDLAREEGLDSAGGVGRLLRTLGRAGKLSPRERSVLSDLVGILNHAAHGAEVDRGVADWATSVGPELLQELDRRRRVHEP